MFTLGTCHTGNREVIFLKLRVPSITCANRTKSFKRDILDINPDRHDLFS